MAIMIPDNIKQFTTEGERQFYKFLETVAKPDSRYISWYLPDIKGKEPDFLFFSDEVGLIIFEVKDWALDQIREANPQYFVLDIGNKTESRKNPFHQARDYFGFSQISFFCNEEGLPGWYLWFKEKKGAYQLELINGEILPQENEKSGNFPPFKLAVRGRFAV